MKKKSAFWMITGIVCAAVLFFGIQQLQFVSNKNLGGGALKTVSRVTIPTAQTAGSSVSRVPTQKSPTANTPQSYALSDLASHNNASSCWMAINGNVYDVTSFISSHPGGSSILNGCGGDATGLFASIGGHRGGTAQSELARSLIGTLR